MITAKTSFGMNSANNNSNIYLPNVNIISETIFETVCK